MSTPVLIYISKETCPACQRFAPEWEKLKQKLSGKVRFVSFRLKGDRTLPPAIQKYGNWYPTILLVSGSEYSKYFTDDDNMRSASGSMHALVFNSVEEHGRLIPAGRPTDSENVLLWVTKLYNKVK